MPNGFRIDPALYMIGDCKYNTKADYWITTPIQERHIGDTPIRVPYLINGSSYVSMARNSNFIASHFFNIFGNCIITKRIEKYNPNGNFVGKKNDKEENIFDISDSQIMPALNDYYKRYFIDFLESQYKQLSKNINIELFQRSWGDDSYNEIIMGLLDKSCLSIFMLIPIIVTNMDIISLKKIDNIKVEEIEEVPFVIYLHSPKIPSKFKEIMENYWEFPIVVVNNKHLQDFINFFEKGINEIIKDIEKNIINRPNLVIEDIKEYNKNMLEKFNLV